MLLTINQFLGSFSVPDSRYTNLPFFWIQILTDVAPLRKLVNRLPLCFPHPNRIFLSNGKHPSIHIYRESVHNIVNWLNNIILLSYYKTMAFHDLVVTFKNFPNYPCFQVFPDTSQFNRHNFWWLLKCRLFLLFINNSLFCFVLPKHLRYWTVINLPFKTLIFHKFPCMMDN